MPELPEVETTRRELLPYVTGRTITGVDVEWAGTVRHPSPETFKAGLKGKRILDIGRRGKYMIFHLDSGEKLIIHMKMSGSLLVQPPSDGRFVRAVIHLDKGAIYFRDPRKFGKMWLVADENEVVGKIGPDPLETGFTLATMKKLLGSRQTPIKVVITDQNIMSGVGNMYADEALYEARIHPLKPAGSLTDTELLRLYNATRRILQAGIVDKGASIENYVRPNGEPGEAHYAFKVAHQKKATCAVCGGPVVRIVVRGRGTYICPKCQKAPKETK